MHLTTDMYKTNKPLCRQHQEGNQEHATKHKHTRNQLQDTHHITTTELRTELQVQVIKIHYNNKPNTVQNELYLMKIDAVYISLQQRICG